MVVKKNTLYKIQSLILVILLMGISYFTMAQGKIDIEGHRGCRGLMPENTIPAMKKAMDLGVTTLEMDIAISKDQQAVVSHDPFMSADFVTKPDGQPVTALESKQLKIYGLNYEEIRKFDVGSRGNAKFPKQQRIAAYKPLLNDLIDSTEAYAEDFNLPAPHYNIETKVTPEGDGIYHPEPEAFMKVLMPLILSKGIEKRVIIQSFDPRTLEIVHRDYPEIKTALLVENLKGFKINMKRLSFKPTIYSPYYKLVDDKTIKDCHKLDIKIVPWTVNTQAAIEDLINKGVDGIITDYPDKPLSGVSYPLIDGGVFAKPI